MYVAFSRCGVPPSLGKGVRVLALKKEGVQGEFKEGDMATEGCEGVARAGVYTRNVVYPEVLTN
jgi:hypothetical protein